MLVYQTYRRKIITLQGTIYARIEIKYCPNHEKPIIIKPDSLTRFAAKGRNYGIDIIIAIGLLRWNLCLQREQIQIYFKRKKIEISTGAISNLSFDFLLLIKQLHEKYIDSLKRYFENRGMIIHADATEEKGGKAVFLIKEERTEITLFAQSMVSEKAEYISPVFQGFKSIFGNPIAIIRDMGSALALSCNQEFPGIPQQICHYHFIHALGKKIFDEDYEKFKTSIIKSELISYIKLQRKLLKLKLKKTTPDFYEPHIYYWLHLVIDYILHPLGHQADYPFRLPYMELYERIIKIDNSLTSNNDLNHISCLKIPPLYKLRQHIHEFIKNKRIKGIFETINIFWNWFVEIRKTMGLLRENLSETRKISKEEFETMKNSLTLLICQIQTQAKGLGQPFIVKSNMIINDLKNKWNELFINLEDSDGNYIPIHRTNNLNEPAHRWLRMRIRRRTGKSRTENEMFQVGPLLAIYSNFYNEEYRKIVCDGINNLAEEFGKLDWNQLRMQRKVLFINNDGLRIPVYDKTREKLVYEFLENIKEKHTVKDHYLDQWLNRMDNYIESWKFDLLSEDDNLFESMEIQ